MEVKEFHYSENDIKGSLNLIEDCKNHYTYIKSCAQESDLDVIINGVKNNLDTVDILKQLSNVSADNLHSIFCGIKDLRQNVSVDDKSIFTVHFINLLYEMGFDLYKFEQHTLCNKKIGIDCNDSYTLLLALISVFVKFCQSKEFDLVDFILNDM